MKFLSSPHAHVGFRRTTPFGATTIPWRFWVGPFFVCRLHRASVRPEFQRISNYVGVSWLGLNVSVSR